MTTIVVGNGIKATQLNEPGDHPLLYTANGQLLLDGWGTKPVKRGDWLLEYGDNRPNPYNVVDTQGMIDLGFLEQVPPIKPSPALVIEFPLGNLRDIPDMLEMMAAKIRNGELGEITSAAGVFLRKEDGLPFVAGCGDTNNIHTMGLLILGAIWLAQHDVKRT